MKNYIYTVLSLCLIFSSCEDIVDSENLIDTKSLVVIHSFISPQNEFISVKVAKAESTIGQISFQEDIKNKLTIKNATVSITNEEGLSFILPYSATNFRYEIPSTDISIEAGKKYFLKVIVDEREFNASCKIPNNKVANITETLTDKQDLSVVEIKSLKVRFNDFVGQKNFFIVGATFQGITSGDLGPVRRFFFNTDRFITDNIGDGLTMSSEGTVVEPFSFDSYKIKIQIANVEEILYKYQQALYLNDNNEDSLIKETVIPPNNIEEEGGFGVFAGYQITEKEISS